MMRGEKMNAITRPAQKRPHKLVRIWRKHYMPICVLTPVIILFLVFNMFPAIYSLFLSFTNYTMRNPSHALIGFQNWQRVLTDDRIWLAMRITVSYTLMYVPVTMALGMVLALLINNDRKGIRFFRAVYFLPSITSAVVLSAVWKSFFTGTSAGLMNSILRLFGVTSPVGWMTNTSLVLPVVASLGVFMGAGGLMIFYLGGMKGIPNDFYESARIDGANRIQSFFRITLPLLRPTILYTLILSTIGSFQVFDAIHVLTQGQPAGATTTIVYSLYRAAFIEFRLGYAATIGYLLFFIVGVIAFVQYKFLGKDVSYE